MDTEKKIEKSIEQIGDMSGPAMDRRIIADLNLAFDSSQRGSLTGNLPTWRIIMQSPITKFASVIFIACAVLIGLHQFGGLTNGKGLVWAEVVEKVETINTLKHRESRIFTIEGSAEPMLVAEVIKYASAEYGVLEEQYNASGELMWCLYILKEGVVFMVLPASKQYIQKELSEQIVQRLNTMISPKGMVECFCSDPYIELGKKIVEGVEAEGFEVQNPSVIQELAVSAPDLFSIEQCTFRLWVEKQSNLPIASEAEAVTNKTFITCFQRVHIKAAAYDVQWGVDLDPAIFLPEIPDDYTQMELPIGGPQ